MQHDPIPPEVCGQADPSELLDIAVRHRDDTVTVSARGEVDLYTSPILMNALHEVISTDAKLVIVDLADVTFMASSGLSVLIDALNQARRRPCQLRLAGGSRPVQVLMSASGAHSEFEHYRSVAEAAQQPVPVER